MILAVAVIVIEKKMMMNASDLESINKEIKKSFDNGAFRFLSDDEIQSFDNTSNQRFYTPIHALQIPCSQMFVLQHN